MSMHGLAAPAAEARDRARAVAAAVPPGLFGAADPDANRVAWRVSPDPFPLAPATLARIEALGPDLLAFYRALTALYARSARGTAPAFVAEYLDRGKSEDVVRLGRQNRTKNDVPCVIRPDLILTDAGFTASELDAVPGGMGFVGAMAHAYDSVGARTVGGADGMAAGLAAALARLAGVERPMTAIVVSREADDYRAELTWLAAAMTRTGLGATIACAPEDVVFTEAGLFATMPDGATAKLDVLYRNFELFDLLNVPKHDLLLYAARHARVKLTPPPKAHLEEKLAFALLHHPVLASTWRRELGEIFERLRAVFPETWVLDPRPLPPHAVIPGLVVAGEPLADWMQLAALGKSERDFVVKPSGFSALAWGARGVKIANDLTKEAWEAALRDGLDAFDRSPTILQRFHKGRRVRVPFLDPRTDEIRELDGRVRLCPYYFVAGDDVRLGGILATVVPADKRIIHGMADAVMAPCAEHSDGW